MNKAKKPAGVIMRVFGIIGGLVVGAIVGAIAMALAAMAAEWQAYTGYIPSPTIGGVAGGAIGVVLGLLFPEKCAFALASLIAD